MNPFVNRLYLLGAVLLVAGCAAGERRYEVIQRQWPATAIRTVEVDGIDGSLSVEAGGADQVTLMARVRSVGVEPRRREDNHGYFETELNGDTLHIGQQKRRVHIGFPFIFRAKMEIEYELRVPATVALDLRMVNGRIASRGVNGATEVRTVNGPIEVETGGSNELSARTVNGSVRAKFLNDFRGARLKTVNGGVEALLPSTASFTCDLSQVNGDFEASFPLSIHSHPGSRRVSGQVNGGQFELQITTVNGDVEVQHVAPPRPPVAPKPPAPSVPPVG